MAGYRDEYFKHNKGKKKLFKKGLYYKCAECGKWFPKSEIDVDHKISKRKGGTDDLWNLQAMCKHCNRSKRERSSNKDIASSCLGAIANGELHTLVGGVVKQKTKDAFRIKYKRG